MLFGKVNLKTLMKFGQWHFVVFCRINFTIAFDCVQAKKPKRT